MRIRRLFALSFLLSLLYALPSKAEKIYILYDEACMDRLEYRLDRTDGRADFMAYHVNVRPGEKLILEVGTESNLEQNYLPEFYLHCANASFDENLMQRINSNTDDVYIIYTRNNRSYEVAPVSLAARYLKSGNTVTYQSPKYSFQADLRNVSIGTNIAYNNPGATVYFEGRLDNNDCNGAFVFRQLQPQSAYPLIDVTLIPEIGIVEERSGPNATAAMNNQLTLQQVNGNRMERYLRDNCGKEPGTRRTANGTAGTTAGTNRPTEFFSAPQGTTTNNAVGPTAAVAATTHTVAKGETLYGIAKKHNLSVDQLKSLNNLNSNVIRAGQNLVVRNAPAQLSTQAVTSAPARTVTTPNAGSMVSRGPAVAANASNSANTVDLSEYHTVRAGETVASIALKYGYTEAKFREINGMGTNEFIRVGQRIKVNDCECPDNSTNVNPAVVTTNAKSGSPGRVLPNEVRQQETVPYSNVGSRVDGSVPVPTPGSMKPGFNPAETRNNDSYLKGQSAQPAPSTYAPNYSTASPYNQAYPNTAQPNNYNQGSMYNQPNNNQSAYPNTTNYGGAPAASANNNTYNSGYNNNPDFSAPAGQVNNYSYPPPANTSTSMRGLESRSNTNQQPAYTPSYNTQNNPNNNYSYGNQNYGTTNPNQPSSYNSTPQNSQQVYNPYGNSANRRVHIVQQGESLYAIAQRYNIQIEQLRALNSLSPGEVIIPYQRLYLN